MPSWYRYAVHGSFDGVDTMRNVFYLETVTPITDHTGVIGELLNQLYLPLAGDLSDVVRISGADVAEYFAGTGWGVNIFYPSIVIDGTNATDLLPHQVAACISAYTLQKGVRGRKFLGGYCEDTQANGNLLAAPYTRLQGFAAQWLAGIVPAGQPAVSFRIWSEKTGLFHALRATAARQLLATMRSRKPGRGIG